MELSMADMFLLAWAVTITILWQKNKYDTAKFMEQTTMGLRLVYKNEARIVMSKNGNIVITNLSDEELKNAMQSDE